MAVTPRIFISATGGDLKSHRTTVAAALKKLETYAEIQDDWPPDYRTVEQMLRRRLKDCDAVIHLVGLRYGAEPRALPPGVARRSYTQMEYHLARELKKPVYLFVLPDTFPYDHNAPAEDEEKRALQQAHRARIIAENNLHYSPPDNVKLKEEILSLQPLVEKLRATLRRQRFAWAAAIAALLLISAGITRAVMREKNVNIEQGKDIAELQRPETVEVKYFKEIQILRSQSPMVAIAQSGGGTASAERMSYAEALAAVAKDHGLTADTLRGQLDAFATRVLADPNADNYERAVAEFHRKNYDAASTLAAIAAESAEKEMKEKRDKAIEAWTLAGDSEKEKVQYRSALTAYQKALVLNDKASTPKTWATLAMKVAGMNRQTGAWKEADALYRESLSLCEVHYGKESPQTATTLNELAQLLHRTNHLAEAEVLLRRALTIYESSYGANHPDAGTALSNLAQLLQNMNHLPEAEALLRRALSIDEATFGKDHPRVAHELKILARLFLATSRPQDAEPLMRRALAISEASRGKDHPDVAGSLNDLALLLKATDRPAEAEPLLRRVVAIWEVSLGENHPDLASALNNLAMLLPALNRLEEAEPLMLRALAIKEAAYGKDHPDVAIALGNLAQLLGALNRLAESEPMRRRSVEILENKGGEPHPYYAAALNNLALLLQDTNRLAEAEPLMRRHLEIYVAFTVTTEHRHPNLEDAIGNYGQLLLQIGDTKEQAQARVDKLLEPIRKK